MRRDDEMRHVRVEVITARSRRGEGRTLGGPWWSFVLRGVLATALGLFALFWPTQGLSVLALAVGLYAIADGAAGLVAALRTAAPPGYLVQPVISLAIGALLALWPEGSLRLLLTAFPNPASHLITVHANTILSPAAVARLFGPDGKLVIE
jgi:uncharacterized membrane protein HdeD (DUF308 family)